MKKAILLASVILGLVVSATPRTEACSTHGYVRASTLNDLFQGTGDAVQFSLPGGTDWGKDNPGELGKVFDPAGFDDHHQYEWKVKGGDWKIQPTGGGVEDELGGIIAQVETSIDASLDHDYAD